MNWIRTNLPLVIAATLSIALHVFVLFPALGILGSNNSTTGNRNDITASSLEVDPQKQDEGSKLYRAASSARKTLQERRDRDRALTPEELERRRQEEEAALVKLGIDESNATTMNWIGYAEYEQHLAELAEVEQAAYRLELAAGSRGSAVSTVAPSEPAPTVATSPNPSSLPLPAAAAGRVTSTPTNLVTQPTPEMASPTPATPPTETALVQGNSIEIARPLPPAEPPVTAAQPPDAATSATNAPPTSSGPDGSTPVEAPGETPGETPRETPSETPPVEPRIEPTTAPLEPLPPTPLLPKDPADGTKPVPPTDPLKPTDPLTQPRTDPTTEPDPSLVDPSKSLDPAASGVAPNALPRETINPIADSPKPPLDAPAATIPLNQNAVASTQAAANPTTDNAVTIATGTQGGGVDGPQPIDGAQSAPTPPSPAGAPGDSRSARGELSDRESDPTSIIDVPMANWQNGKPLAAKGITLKPARPRFTTLNYVDGVGRNPIGELVLGRDGVPQIARVVRSTGNPGIDDAIKSALFKWRASGKELEKLKPGQTITIRLRIIMLQD